MHFLQAARARCQTDCLGFFRRRVAAGNGGTAMSVAADV